MTKERDNFKIDFIGIGAQRCATSWIFKCLQEHSQICAFVKKEAAFFNDERKNFEWYKSLFGHCATTAIKGEYSPHYMHPEYDPKQKTAERIKNTFPDVKIIACLRNPIERARSQYFLEKLRNKETAPTFKKAILKNHHKYIEAGFYYTLLKKYLELFPRENILILIYEDIRKSPIGFIQNIYSFLGVDSNFVPPSVNKKVSVLTGKQAKAFYCLDKVSVFLKNIL